MGIAARISVFHLLITLPLFALSTLDTNAGVYSVFRLRPKDASQLSALHQIHRVSEYDFWKEPAIADPVAEVMISPVQMREFRQFLNETQIPFEIIVPDVAKLILEKEGPENPRNRALRLLGDKSVRRDSVVSHGFGLSMGEYYSYEELVNFMRRIHSAMPNRTRLVSIGRTVEGRDTLGIQFGNPADKTRPVVWIDSGIHAREWTSVHTGQYWIALIANAILDGRDSAHRKVVDFLQVADVVIFPCVNPDGYEYTRVDPSLVEYRMWRKNRSPEVCRERNGQQRCCSGVDLNRNFAYQFSALGTSFSPCSEIYHGSGAFSEPESRNIRDAVVASDLRGRIPAFVTLHAYSQLLIYPFSNRKFNYPTDVEDLKSVAKRAVAAIGEKFGTNYQYGTGPEIIYAYTGGSSDWAKETAKIKYTYTIELRPGYWAWNGFVLDKSQLIPTAREAFDGVQVIMDTVAASTPRRTSPRPAASAEAASTLRPAKCSDKSPNCDHWLTARPTLCADAQRTMSRECRRSCGLC